MIDYRISGMIAGAAFILSFLLGLLSGSRLPGLIVRPLFFAFIFFGIAAMVKYIIARFLPELLEKGSMRGSPRRPAGSRINIKEDFSPEDSSAYIMDNLAGAPSAANAAVPASSSGVTLGNISDLLRKKAAGDPPPPGTPPSDQGLGNISDLLRKKANPAEAGSEDSGIDQKPKVGYNDAGGDSVNSPGDSSGEIPMWDFDKGISALPRVPVTEKSLVDSPVTFENTGKRPGGRVPGDTEILPDLDSMAGVFSQALSDDVPAIAEYSSGSYHTPVPSKRRSSGAPEASWSGDFNPRDIAKGLQTVLSKDKEG